MSSVAPDFPHIPFTDKKPFFGLNVVCAGQVFFVILGFIFGILLTKNVPNVAKESFRGFIIFLLLKDLVVALLLWRGIHWARWLFIVATPFSLWQLLSPSAASSAAPDFERVFVVANNLWTIGVALWLLLPGVAQHFTRRNGDTSSEINAG